MKRLMGLIRFNHSIFCDGETMGNSFCSKIGDVKIKLYLPQIMTVKKANDEYDFIVKEPVICQFNKFDNWGYVRQWNRNVYDLKNVGVEVRAVTFICEVTESEMQDTVKVLSKGINLWRAQLYECCFLGGEACKWY